MTGASPGLWPGLTGQPGTFETATSALDALAAEIIEVARHAELLGFDPVWVHDHLVMPATIRARYPNNESGVAGFAYRQDIYDPIAIMAALAVKTERVRIGSSVLIIPYRNPVLLARMLATLDPLADGRIILGLGVGWMSEDFDALGISDYYPVRGSVTDEPTIPLWVGGKGAVAARRVARYGTGYQAISSTPEEIRQELKLVRAELEARGREPSEITRVDARARGQDRRPRAESAGTVSGSRRR